MINDRGLLGERQITFSHQIKENMPVEKLCSALIGSAVLYKDEELYITNVFNVMNYFNLLSFTLSDGSNVNQADVRFFVSDENDETESSNLRIESIKNDYNLYKNLNTRLPYSDELRKLKASYDPNLATELRDSLNKETNLYTKMYHEAQKNFLSIINSLKHVIVKVHYGETNTASIITTIQDYAFNSRPPKLDNPMKIEFNYDDIMIKINGSFIPVTAKNLKFIYDYKHLTFKELLEMHNNKQIKSHLGELPK